MRDCRWLDRDNHALTTGHSFGLMGILNVTPDSFYDGGKLETIAQATDFCGQLLRDGADIIDIGAESSRPGANPVTAEEEQVRLLPVLAAIRVRHPAAVLSVDTVRASTAALALEQGASIINDISACDADPELVDVLAQYRPAYVLMHSQGKPATMQLAPRYDNVVEEVKAFFERKLNELACAGLGEEHVVLDPGIGFGKKLEHNLALLQNIGAFMEFGRPVLVGLSMKSFFSDLLAQPLEKRAESTALASAILWQKGVFWHRIHNVGQVRKALLLAEALAGPNMAQQK